jgi:hypothetical protein
MVQRFAPSPYPKGKYCLEVRDFNKGMIPLVFATSALLCKVYTAESAGYPEADLSEENAMVSV